MNRRDFISTTAVATAAISLSGTSLLAAPRKNPLPRWRGFNLLDFFSPDPGHSRPQTSEDNFRWMRDWGFDFVRIPMAYPYYLDIDHSKNIVPE